MSISLSPFQYNNHHYNNDYNDHNDDYNDHNDHNNNVRSYFKS